MPKTKILINFITSDGNVINPLLWKIKNYPKSEFDVSLFCDKKVKKQVERGNYKFIELPYTKETKSKLSFLFESLKRNLVAVFYIKKVADNFDVVYSVSSVLDLVIFPFLVKMYKRKIVWVTVFDNVVPFSDPGSRLTRILAWIFFKISLILIRKCNYIFVSTPELMEFLVKSGFNKSKLIQSNLGCDEESIISAKYNEKYNYDALYLGRINETKGIDDLLEVLKIVKEKYPKFSLALVGGGDELTISKYKKKISKEGLDSNVKMLGWVSEAVKYELLKSCKTFWFLSVSQCESFGIALLEAVCSGKPAFVYDLPQMKNIYCNGEINIFKIHDVKSVAREVLKVFDKRSFYNEKGIKLLGKYSWKSAAMKEVKTLEKVFSYV